MLVSKKDGSRMLSVEGILFLSFVFVIFFFFLNDLGFSLSCAYGEIQRMILCAISFLCWILTERFTV